VTLLEKLPINETKFVTAEIIQILEGLHSHGIIHRDLKPENLIIDERNHLRIIDFGTAEVFHIKGKNTDLYNSYCKIREKYAPIEPRESADENAPHYDGPEINSPEKIVREQNGQQDVDNLKKQTEDQLTISEKAIQLHNNFMAEYQDNLKHRKSFVGTVYYVAPEMLESQEVDCGCDLWALGIIINKMLTGEYLFNEPNDYLTFEAIRKGEYKLSPDLPEEAKDLITRLLVKNPKERLGNGPEGSATDFKALKSHPFFKDLEWSLLQSCASPLNLDKTQPVEEERDSDLEENKILMALDRKNNRNLVLSGLVKKMKYVFMYNTRQLMLYSDGSLEYFDPNENALKGRVECEKSTTCYVKSDYVFHVSLKEREYVFNSVDIPAKVWVEKIKEVLRFL
jgi:serine/threonine protein kinase